MASKVIPKKKSKRRQEIKDIFDPAAQKKLDREISNAIADYDEQMERRYEYAQRILAANDASVKAAVDSMVEAMEQMAGPPTFRYQGILVNPDSKDPQRFEIIQHRMFVWIAVRLIVASAKWGIRIANFKPPAGVCIDCGLRTQGGKK